LDLKITDTIHGDIIIVTLDGELDIYTSPQLREHLAALITSGEKRIAIDMNECGYLDSSGLGVIVGALKKIRRNNGQLDIICTTERVLTVFRITGLTKFFAIHATAAAAAGMTELTK
jgi:anti-sigma B factor antagonist